MKFLKTLSLLSATVLITSCGSEEPKTYRPTPFASVAKNLDQGGDYYMILSAEQAIKKVTDSVNSLVAILEPELNKNAVTKDSSQKIIKAVRAIVSNIGLNDIQGVGLSSLPMEEHLNRVRLVATHKSENGEGLIWKLSDGENKALDFLKMAPTDSVLVSTGNLNLEYLYNWLDTQAKLSGVPELKDGLKTYVDLVKIMAKVDILELIKSTNSEVGLIVTLDETKKTTITDTDLNLSFSQPNVAIMFKVKNDKIFNQIAKNLPPTFVKKGKDGLNSITIPVPAQKELKGLTIAPTITQVEDMLIISLNDTIVPKMLAARKSGKDITKTANFKKLANDIPLNGISGDYLDNRFAKEIGGLYTDILIAAVQGTSAETEGIINLVKENFKNKAYFSVSSKINNGIVCKMNNENDTISELFSTITLVPVAYGSIIAAIAVPSLSNNRASAISQTKVANIKIVQAAMANYLANDINASIESVTFKNLEPYLSMPQSELNVDGQSIKIKNGKVYYQVD